MTITYILALIAYLALVLLIGNCIGLQDREPKRTPLPRLPRNNLTITGPYRRKRLSSAWWRALID